MLEICSAVVALSSMFLAGRALRKASDRPTPSDRSPFAEFASAVRQGTHRESLCESVKGGDVDTSVYPLLAYVDHNSRQWVYDTHERTLERQNLYGGVEVYVSGNWLPLNAS